MRNNFRHVALRLVIYSSSLATTLLFSSLASASTTQGTLSTNIWSYGKEVTISGVNLEGLYFRSKKLCFAPEVGNEVCLGHYDDDKKQWSNDSDFIKIWNGNTILFTPPSNTPYRGTVKLYTTNDERQCVDNNPAYCNTLPTESHTIIDQYTAKPLITGVVEFDSMQPASTIKVGKRYEIQGALFGNSNGDIFFGEAPVGILRKKGIARTDIVSWAHNSIVFSPSEPVDFSYGVKVNNGATDSDVFLPNSSEQPTSSAQSSSVSSVNTSTNSTFPDVLSSHPYYPAIAWAKSLGVLTGYPDGTFRPNQVVNRAELLKILLKAANTDTGTDSQPTGFSDVNENAWYVPYLRAAKRRNIVQGYPNGTFKPAQPVNAAEALKMAYTALNVTTQSAPGPWYARFLDHAKTNNVLFSSDLDIGQGMARKDIAWIVWKLMTYNGEWQQPITVTESSVSSETTKDQPNQLDIKTISLNSYWTNWDADAETDGFELSAFWKNGAGQQVYPKSKDWLVTVNVYDTESNYDKYGDFFKHKVGSPTTLSFQGKDVLAKQILGDPYVQVPKEKFPKASNGYYIVEATFASSTYGTFSGKTDVPDWRNK